MINQRIILLATAALWILLSTAWFPGVWCEPCGNIKIIDSSNVTIPTNEICQARYRTPNCRKFVETFNQNDLPHAFRVSKPSVGKPEDLVVTGTEFQHNGIIYPGVMIAWSNPLSGASKQNLLGFLLVWYSMGPGYVPVSNQKYCQVFLLNISHPLVMDNLRYEYNIPKVEDKTVLAFKVYSIPAPPAMDMDNPSGFERIAFFAPEARYVTDYGIEPAKWSPYISAKTLKNGILEIMFNYPPNYMELYLYQIALIKEKDPAHPVYNYQYAIPEDLHRYTAVQQFNVTSSGCYIIMIWVIERPESRMVPGQCGCWSLDNEGKKKCENICGSSQVRVCVLYQPGAFKPVDDLAHGVTVVPKEPKEESRQMNEVGQPSKVSSFTMVASILGIIMIVVLVGLMGLVVVFAFIRKKH